MVHVNRFQVYYFIYLLEDCCSDSKLVFDTKSERLTRSSSAIQKNDMPSSKKTKHKRKPSSLTKLEKICESYGVKVFVDEFSVEIDFKDSKHLYYMIGHEGGLRTILEDIEKNGIHGRVFKDSKFIGYAPEKKSLGEILIAVDMMV